MISFYFYSFSPHIYAGFSKVGRVGPGWIKGLSTVQLQGCYSVATSLNEDRDLAGLKGWNGFKGKDLATKARRQKGGTNEYILIIKNKYSII